MNFKRIGAIQPRTKKLILSVTTMLLIIIIGFQFLHLFTSSRNITVKSLVVTVTTSSAALDPGATLFIKQAPTYTQNLSPEMVPLGNPIQILPTNGDLHGKAILKFTYPQQLPQGITPDLLMIMEYSPVVNAWLPDPSILDTKNRQLIVTTTELSAEQNTVTTPIEHTNGLILSNYTQAKKPDKSPKSWLLEYIPTDLFKEIGAFGGDIAKDAYQNHGDFIAGLISRMLPSPPQLNCEKNSNRLLTNVIDQLLLFQNTVCVQDTQVSQCS